MSRRINFLVLLVAVVLKVNAQQASPMLSDFIESRDIENQNWAICQDGNHVMFFANRRGILIFDGDDWQAIKIPIVPYSMQKNPADGKIYVGGENSFGFLERNSVGSYSYVSLESDSSGGGEITKIIFDGPVAWFYGDQAILRYNFKSGKTDLRLDPKQGTRFSGMFATPSNTFVNVSGEGLYRLESDTLFPIVTGYLTEKTEILFSLPYSSKLVLVGMSNGNLSLFDGIKYYPYPINDEGYLKNNIISDGLALGDTAYAFSTLDGGAEIVEKKSGNVLFTINSQIELPDDEIFAIGSDNNGGLWLSHQYGLTRADLNLPIRNYSVYAGLTGNLSSALRYDNELYVATSEGIYYLTEARNYAGTEILVRNRQAVEKNGSLQEDQNSRKNIFSRIFGKKTRDKMAANEGGGKKIPEGFTRKKVTLLKSVTYSYKKIEGVNEKCRQLVGTPYGILAATNKGLYSIVGHKASLVVPDRYVNCVSWEPFSGKYYIGASEGYFTVRYELGKWLEEIPDPGFINPVYSVSINDNKILWIGGDNIAYRTSLAATGGGFTYSSYRISKNNPERYVIDQINDSIFLFTESGIHLYDAGNDRFISYHHKRMADESSGDFVLPMSNQRLVRQDYEWFSMQSRQQVGKTELSILKIFDDVVSVDVEAKVLYVIAGNKLYCIDRLKSSQMNRTTDIFIKSISNDRGTSFDLANVKFDRGDNVINFSIIAPEYLKKNTTRYQYNISRIMTGWSPWSVSTHYSKTILHPGDYVLKVRAMDIWGNTGEPQSLQFTIRAPFTRTMFFYVLTGLVTLAIIVLIVRFRERQLHNQNKILEEKVKERTAEIEAQKEEITASIEYASRIQMAILPVDDHFRESFSDCFIFYRPRDIVSGDFYWIGESDNSVCFTVADCTGHGVPGAFMSSMGISTLQEIIANNRNFKANTVLNLLREKIMTTLHQTGKVGEAADGMDIAFCVIDKDKKVLQYSGAYNPLFIIQGGELKEYKADRMPIGIHYGEPVPFTNYVINVSKGDTIYIFSDGFADQFGGPEGSKYKKSNLKKLLSDVYYRPMTEQRNIIEAEFNAWRGSGDQIDDVTVMGIRI